MSEGVPEIAVRCRRSPGKARRAAKRFRKWDAMTLAEYLETPETVRRQELVRGAVRVADSPSSGHQRLVAQLFLALREHVSERTLGEVWFAPLDVILDAKAPLVVQPDLFFVAADGAAVVQDKVYGPPDLVIEVISPRTRDLETTERLGWFATCGVRECWLVHQRARSVDVLMFAGGTLASRRTFGQDDRIVSAVLPEFRRSLEAMTRLW
jgi:Uma2 family endonuclease